LEDHTQNDLIQINKKKIENYLEELPMIVESIFEKEKDLSLTLMNISLNEYSGI